MTDRRNAGRPPRDGTGGGRRGSATGAVYRGAQSLATRRSAPVISGGTSTPSSDNTVGPTSQSAAPLLTSGWASPSISTNGTGLVVWAVCGPPVAVSIICSQLP